MRRSSSIARGAPVPLPHLQTNLSSHFPQTMDPNTALDTCAESTARILDDGGDPHLRSSDDMAGLTSIADTRKEMPYDIDDPYFRLDEVDPGSLYLGTSPPNIRSSRTPSEQSRGWLAHQLMQLRSPS